MRNWDSLEETGTCQQDQDWRDVQRVCAQLSIPCHSVDPIPYILILNLIDELYQRILESSFSTIFMGISARKHS